MEERSFSGGGWLNRLVATGIKTPEDRQRLVFCHQEERRRTILAEVTDWGQESEYWLANTCVLIGGFVSLLAAICEDGF